MKGLQGLFIAAGLGCVGAVFNWIYLAQKSKEVETVSFIGIGPDVNIRPGTTIRESHLVRVAIPGKQVGNLRQFAYLYSAVATVPGMRANRRYRGGELLLRQDLKTPPAQLPEIGEDERYMFIPVDTKALVSSFIVPGKLDLVDFLVPPARPTPPIAAP